MRKQNKMTSEKTSFESIGSAYIELDLLVSRELETKRLLCWKDGKLIPELVDQYADICKRAHHMGIDCYKHNCTANKYYKMLREQKYK